MSWQRIELLTFFHDARGIPLAGGLVYTYNSVDQSEENTACDSEGTLNTNPIVLDEYGHCEIWLDPNKSYRIEVKNADGESEYHFDDVTVPSGSGDVAQETAQRIAADNNLQQMIGDVSGNLSYEATLREQYDNALNQKIEDEISERERSTHFHDNKELLDDIDSDRVEHWDSAYSNSHTHSNKSVLDDITAERVEQWDEGSTPISTVNVTVDSSTGNPHANATVSGSTMTIAFSGIKGEKGDDGTSVEHSWNGTELTITSASGTTTTDLKGERGERGTSLTAKGTVDTTSDLYNIQNPGYGDMYIVLSDDTHDDNSIYIWDFDESSHSAGWVFVGNMGTAVPQCSEVSMTATKLTISKSDGSSIECNIPTFNQSTTGNAATATKATSDSDGNNIKTTYATKSEVQSAIASVHSHTNKGVLDGITATLVSTWNGKQGSLTAMTASDMQTLWNSTN